jgi:hypothetical protein
MAKQLALDQAGRQGGTIDLDQRPVTSRAQIVQRAGHQLLASSRFADEQDRRIGRGDRLDKPEHPLHFWTLAGDFLEVVLGLDLLLQIAVLLFQAGAKPRDLLIRPHVLDGEGNLLRHAFEKRNVLERVSIWREARQQYGSDGPVPRDERNNQVRARSSGEQDLVPREPRLYREVVAEARLLVFEGPADGRAVRADLPMCTMRVPFQLPTLQRDRAKDILLRNVEQRAIKRDDLAQGLADRVEE